MFVDLEPQPDSNLPLRQGERGLLVFPLQIHFQKTPARDAALNPSGLATGYTHGKGGEERRREGRGYGGGRGGGEMM